jgi:2,3,4,5-tetrahydropyridine-2,6-dicarboxylate N-succinyltransferase
VILYDVVRDRIYRREGDRPLEVPAGAVVVPGTRSLLSGAGLRHGLQLYAPVIVKYRDGKTDLSTRLEELLR